MHRSLLLIALVFVAASSTVAFAQTKTEDNSQKALLQGKDFFQQGRYQDALASFRELSITSSPSQADASFWVVKSLLALNKLDEAQIQLETFLKNYHSDPNAEEGTYLRGRILYLMADLLASVKSFTLFLEQYPNSTFAANAYYWLGESLLSLGQLDEAKAMFAKVTKEYASSFKAEAASYKLSLIDQRSREESLLELLKWSHQENIKNIDDFNRKEQVYQEALRSYQKKLTSLAPKDFQDELRTVQGKLDAATSDRDAANDRIKQLNAQIIEVQKTLQKTAEELQASKQQIADLRSNRGQNDESLAQRQKLLDVKEQALNLKEQALLNLEKSQK